MKIFIVLLGMAAALTVFSCARRVVVVSNADAAVIRTAPAHHKIVVVKGRRYYFWDGRHYRKTRRGFMIVHF